MNGGGVLQGFRQSRTFCLSYRLGIGHDNRTASIQLWLLGVYYPEFPPVAIVADCVTLFLVFHFVALYCIIQILFVSCSN